MPRAISIFTVGFEVLCCFPGSIDGSRNNVCVTNKEICLVRIVFIYVYGAVLFVRSATDRKKRPFFLAIGFAVSTPLLRHNRL